MKNKRILFSMILSAALLLSGCQSQSQGTTITLQNERSLLHQSVSGYDLIITQRYGIDKKYELPTIEAFTPKELVHGIPLSQIEEPSFPDFRKKIDYILDIKTNVITEQGIEDSVSYVQKRGCIYDDNSGLPVAYPSLLTALQNHEFSNRLNNHADGVAFANAATARYSDLGSEPITLSQVRSNEPEATRSYKNRYYASINAYFNLLSDDQASLRFGAERIVSREEFYALLYRASHGTDEFTPDSTIFESYIGGKTALSLFAAQEWHNGFLQLSDGSLSEANYKGAITTAEAVYTIINKYFHDDLKNMGKLDTNATLTVGDTVIRNAGNIAQKQKFNEHQTKAYVLQHILDHAQDGMDEEIFKAYTVLLNKGITFPTISWYQPLTKVDALKLVSDVYRFFESNGDTIETIIATPSPVLSEPSKPVHAGNVFAADTGHVYTISELVTFLRILAKATNKDFERVLNMPKLISLFNYEDPSVILQYARSYPTIYINAADISEDLIDSALFFEIPLYQTQVTLISEKDLLSGFTLPPHLGYTLLVSNIALAGFVLWLMNKRSKEVVDKEFSSTDSEKTSSDSKNASSADSEKASSADSEKASKKEIDNPTSQIEILSVERSIHVQIETENSQDDSRRDREEKHKGRGSKKSRKHK